MNTHDCKICGQRQSSSSNLKLHIATHLNINLPCAFCDDVFNSEMKLKVHTLQVHGKEKIYSVSTETKLLVDNSVSKKAKSKYLRTFINEETRQKVYRCKECKIEDSNKEIMSKHVKKHHTSKMRTVGL